MPTTIVSRTFLVRQATRMASRPAISRALPTEISSDPLGRKRAGATSAERTATGTKRRACCKKGGICAFPRNTMKERRIPKVSSPTTRIVIQSNSCDIDAFLRERLCFAHFQRKADGNTNQGRDRNTQFQRQRKCQQCG